MIQIKEQKLILNASKYKLMLAQNRQKKDIEEKLNENNEEKIFESALKEAGFKIMHIEKNINYMKCVVNNDYQARAKLLNILKNIEYKELNDGLEIVWIFDQAQDKSTEIEKNDFQLNGICFFSKSSWQVWINGKMYDTQNKAIGHWVIEQVTDSLVILKQNDEQIVLELN
jgi:hypothetical protein